MSAKYLLPFAASLLLIETVPCFSLPAQPMTPLAANAAIHSANTRFTNGRSINGRSTNHSSTNGRSTNGSSTDVYGNCKRVASAVVTIYAGREIGSGSLVSSEGLVLTNQHVVQEIVQSGNRKQIFVKTAAGDRYTGHLLGTDSKNDLALVQLNTQDQFPTVQFADIANVRAGQPVCAIGSPYGRPGVLSQGTFSTFRSNGDLKSAVLLHPGNSGGPLLNAQGDMIGINKAIWESNTGQNTGISFATNAIVAKNFIEQLHPLTAATTPIPTSPHLGVVVDVHSLVVKRVEVGSPAALGGLQAGDRLVAINGTQLDAFEKLQAFLNHRPNSALLTIQRNQKLATVQVDFWVDR